MTNAEREAYDMLVNMRALFDEFMRNKPLIKTNDKGIVTWPVFKTAIRFDDNVPDARENAVAEYMNKRGIKGTFYDITMVGQVGVDGYFNQYKKTLGA